MNTKSLCVLIAFLFLLIAVACLGRFGYDVWIHFHSTAGASTALDYGALSAALAMVIAGGVFGGVALLLDKYLGW